MLRYEHQIGEASHSTIPFAASRLTNFFASTRSRPGFKISGFCYTISAGSSDGAHHVDWHRGVAWIEHRIRSLARVRDLVDREARRLR
jgi:hypothetical protein